MPCLTLRALWPSAEVTRDLLVSLGRCWHCFPGSVSAASAVSRTAGLSASRCGPCHSKPSGFYQQEAVPRPHFPRGSPVSGPGASLMAAGPNYPAVRWGMASDTGAASLPVSTDECIGIQHLPTADWVPGHPLSQKLKLRATFWRSHGPGGTAQDLNPGPPSPRGYPRSHPSIHHRTDTPRVPPPLASAVTVHPQRLAPGLVRTRPSAPTC